MPRQRSISSKQHILVRPPLSVFEPMHHFVFSALPSPGPVLCVAACELVGGHRDQAIAAAAALHLMHAAAVTHEQLLSTDGPNIKPKPRPMVHSAGIELLTGDGIFAFGAWWMGNTMRYCCCANNQGGASEEEIERLRRYGLCVGVMRAFSNRVEEGNEMETMEVVKELRSLALKELEFFHEGKAEAISSFLHLLSL
ncbi:unnamed protein product [Prunus armeniaca]|uniref:Uncharacterized protein n=1 Tax=Prunus armeniaca TaxID=36596 RepID=A0A6J5UPA0_PRUAR|nr:unnamed protein product [Prunus armeniaca]